MDKAVIDSSVAIKWFVVEPHSNDARRVLNEYQSGTLSLLAPDLIDAEVGNIVWKKQRFQGLAAADAYLIIEAFRMLTLSLPLETRNVQLVVGAGRGCEAPP
jgi:predicted nucleic acid-binding protein